MTLIDTDIEIARSPAEVRAVVLDLERMREWLTSFRKVLRPLPNGKRPEEMQQGGDMFLKFLSLPGQNVKVVMRFSLPCATIPEHCPITTSGEQPRRSGLGGWPCVALSRHPQDGVPTHRWWTRDAFRNSDLYSGIFGAGAALPGIKGNVSKLFEGYNRDLKKRCEQGAATTKV